MGDKKTIQQIKEQIAASGLTNEEVSQLKLDSRKGVRTLLQQYERELQKKRTLRMAFYEMRQWEQKCFAEGKTCIAGIDEAGRGPLAGPVVAAAVILPEGFYLEGLNDSKQLSLAKREEFYTYITKTAATSTGLATNNEIDELNIYQATKLAMQRAVAELPMKPDHLLIDAMEIRETACTQESIIKGDQKSVSIAAASVIAKVSRDRLMKKIHKEFPVYEFSSNQGYGTKQHLEAMEKHGVSPYHRQSFSPVKNLHFV
ncbi:ribonuclease HII [Halobacillus salinarum]|uniref:Ribonuclease HII n=1 Tax=Halobacillus salinarum TaxID=2932257 RepID=A0ABY4EGE1_9BACI|nr:ribonuclease HII [Halobacillus salinarum]UOQ43070.1 ribonuclease HII [Halobacillus salinarum]